MYKNVIRMGNANQGRKANTFGEITELADDSAFFVLQKIGGVRKARQFTKEDFITQFVGSFVNPIVVTYAELLALSAANNLRDGAWYKITNATAANINLIVQAIATNQIHCDAKDPLYPNDKVMYNFASNVITWRWDTVRDVSAGEDWRNSNNLQIPDSCTRVTIGSGCTVTLGENSVNVVISNGCTINASLSNCIFAAASGVTCDVLLQNLHFYAAINLTNSPQKATVTGDASNYGIINYNTDGVVFLQYIASDGTFTTIQLDEA